KADPVKVPDSPSTSPSASSARELVSPGEGLDTLSRVGESLPKKSAGVEDPSPASVGASGRLERPPLEGPRVAEKLIIGKEAQALLAPVRAAAPGASQAMAGGSSRHPSVLAGPSALDRGPTPALPKPESTVGSTGGESTAETAALSRSI